MRMINLSSFFKEKLATMKIHKFTTGILLIQIVYFSFACSHDTGEVSQQQVNQPSSAIKQGANKPAVSAIKLNVPSLIGLTIEQIEARLGKPISKVQTNPIGTDSARTYRIGNYELMADYFVDKRVVDTFFFTTVTGRDKSYDQLLVLAAGNLQTTAPNYRVEPFDQADRKRRVGVLIKVSVANTTVEE